MSSIELTSLKFILNETEFYERIRMERGTRRAKPIERILDSAKEIPKPKALYCVSEAKIVNDSQFTLDGILFTSKIGVEKIADSKFVIPNIVTAGVEIEDYCFTRESVLEQYIVMEICNFACQFAKDEMIRDIKKNYGIALKECIFPGEEGFLLESGKKIFDVFGDVESKIGVSISEMGLPTPSRSAYSICFA
ncbi:hypothetical protein [Acetobacterium tundrae]|uniref:Uncharacterized protein n=1 Tax=Acetobacterium tundrae TaxID=132932 RepID=A0ABR6WHM9_9FIRM|nr:hypothetical protein [Acetobacterium tundrae]MBC3795731.1 hypothetical protein [Acetobacterium tundrae]